MFNQLLCQNIDTNTAFTPQRLSHLNDNGFVIGGSLALRLYGYDIKRPINEVDLIVSNTAFDGNKTIKFFEDLNDHKHTSHVGDSQFCFEGLNGELYDILVWKGDVKYVTRVFDGVEVKLQLEDDIWHKKKEYAYKGYDKHKNDLRYNNKFISVDEYKYFDGKFPKQDDFDLPF